MNHTTFGSRLRSALLAIAVVATPLSAFAGGQLYLLSNNPPHWTTGQYPVGYNINPASATGNIDGVDAPAQFANAVMSAFQSWEDLGTATITFQRNADSTLLTDNSGTDGVNLMVFNNVAIVQGIPLPLPAGVLGVTNTFFDTTTGVISGGAITLNTEPLPDHPNPDYSTSGVNGTLDVEAIVLHEAGHYIGMCHSAVRNSTNGDLVGQPTNAAVMFPFLGDDIADSRVPDEDDVAWASKIYPAPSYGTSFGAIQGDLPLGTGAGCGGGADGVHVVARRLDQLVGGQPRMVVGTYSYTEDGPQGRWTIPGLPPGQYAVWAEPLDGSPVSNLQVNSRTQFGATTNILEDWYSGSNESGTEPNPGDVSTATLVTVTAGQTTSGKNIQVQTAAAVNGLVPMAAPIGLLLASRRVRRRRVRALDA